MKFNSFLLLATFAGLLIVEGQVKSSEEGEKGWVSKYYSRDDATVPKGPISLVVRDPFNMERAPIAVIEIDPATTIVEDLFKEIAAKTDIRIDDIKLCHGGIRILNTKKALLDMLGRDDIADPKFFLLNKIK